jgi:very-short-patch-repair endonuclease
VLDFCCARLKVAIEVDGRQHESAVEYDGQRSAYLSAKGIAVMRIPNALLAADRPMVEAQLQFAVDARIGERWSRGLID